MIVADQLLNELGYTGHPQFVEGNATPLPPEWAHTLRRSRIACEDRVGGQFRGMYTLCTPGQKSAGALIPVVYVAEAPGVDQADEIHRRIWNQGVVPFLLVQTPQGIRLYTGFSYESPKSAKGQRAVDEKQRGVLETAIALHEIQNRLAVFQASQINNGLLWRQRGADIKPESRVDQRLVMHLNKLGDWLCKEARPTLKAHAAHALIGRYVYLRYLLDRDILSARRCEELGVNKEKSLGRNTDVRAFTAFNEAVDGWLNGSIFPFNDDDREHIKDIHIQQVAAVFSGDDAFTGQLHLDFRAYDFSYIPIETLSTVYEQFLARENKTRDEGAYYTPLVLVNFVLAELSSIKPLRPGMQVFDPACGSGAFLVQCYQRLVEYQRTKLGRPQHPSELRSLLTDHIYGLDRDEDACHVTALSLILSMLDHLDPPDLMRNPNFKLPTLLGTNVVQGDFFALQEQCPELAEKRFDWIVGNPPWVKVKSKSSREADRPVLRWIEQHKNTHKVVGNQVAEAFAHQALSHIQTEGIIGFVLPAMSLFEAYANFRKSFLTQIHLYAVANFSNLRRALFGEASHPATAIFYGSADQKTNDNPFLVYSPMVVNQEANRPAHDGTILPIWSIAINRSEIRYLSNFEVTNGDALPWKLAMWGDYRDMRLLRRMAKYPSYSSIAERYGLSESESFQLDTATSDEMWNGMRVSMRPHIILNAARTSAIYSDQYSTVPPQHIGIGGPPGQALLLKALALYLISDFARYHQFLCSPQWGCGSDMATLDALRKLPIPISAWEGPALETWVDLHRRRFTSSSLSFELNALVSDALGLRTEERWLVHDLVHIRMALIDGKVGEAAVHPPNEKELQAYAEALRDALDGFVAHADTELRHRVTVVHEQVAGMVQIEGIRPSEGGKALPVCILPANTEVGRAMRQTRERIETERGPWLYFDRNLMVYASERIFLCKPMQRLAFLQSQALSDADMIIEDTLSAEGQA